MGQTESVGGDLSDGNQTGRGCTETSTAKKLLLFLLMKYFLIVVAFKISLQ